jgi:hypothetical protein
VLAGGAGLEADAPGEPLGAGLEPRVPAAPRVELPDQLQKPRGGRLEMRGKLGDLVAEPFEGGDVGVSRDEVRSIESGRHDESLRVNRWSHFTPRIFGRLRAARTGNKSARNDFVRHRHQ